MRVLWNSDCSSGLSYLGVSPMKCNGTSFWVCPGLHARNFATLAIFKLNSNFTFPLQFMMLQPHIPCWGRNFNLIRLPRTCATLRFLYLYQAYLGVSPAQTYLGSCCQNILLFLSGTTFVELWLKQGVWLLVFTGLLTAMTPCPSVRPSPMLVVRSFEGWSQAMYESPRLPG